MAGSAKLAYGLFWWRSGTEASSNLQTKSWQPPTLELSLELRHGQCLRLSLGGDRHDLRSGGESRAWGGGER